MVSQRRVPYIYEYPRVLQILRMRDVAVIQEWKQTDATQAVVEEITWLENGKKLAYHIEGLLKVYDFEKNLKYRWGADD